MRLIATLAVASSLLVGSLPAADAGLAPPPTLNATEWVEAAAAIDGDTLRLADGRVVRLLGLAAPKPEDASDANVAKVAAAARQTLAMLALGKPLGLAFEGPRGDRHRRILAHVVAKDGTWLAAALVTAGLARVRTTADQRSGAARLLALEAEARAARRGLWALAAFRVLDTAAAGSQLDRFHLVEGRVIATSNTKGRLWLNFGSDWRTDFTVALDGAAQRRFKAAGVDPVALHGKIIRVRGWLRLYNGPLIDVTHPEQIEVVMP